MNKKPTILIAEDTDSMREAMVQILKKEGYQLIAVSNGENALSVLKTQCFDIVITDYKMGKVDGLDVLKAAKDINPDNEVLIITAYGSIELAVKLMKAGAWDFITKPFSKETLIHKVDRTLKHIREREQAKKLIEENAYLKNEINQLFNTGEMIGKTPEMLNVFKSIKKIASSDSAVLIFGESGTGKELVARAIHQNSPRKEATFVRVNCGALAEGVLESELFGHEKGAFTGAFKQKKGRFELAHQGTLFLDEIGDIPLNTQIKLLRVIQEKEFERVGGEETLQVNVRIIAATHRNLPEEVKAGRFREDLYYRLHILPVTLPPLRQRKEDIPLLAPYFLNKMTSERGLAPHKFTKEALDMLMGYPWPGNVRELENAIERALVLNESDTIDSEELSFLNAKKFGTEIAQTSWNLEASLAETERVLLQKAMKRSHGVKARAARLLGIKEGALYYKLEKYGLMQKE
ncbi:sigma-54-dependent Fis family transcriptional regulator [bacterium]|nr:sigma-54-dependent Fis family transcriptional regulator [bacterium]